MHRSGKSCLAGTLQQARGCLDEVSTENKFNKKGNREHSAVMQLNNDLLRFNNASWDSPSAEKEWNHTHIARGRELITLFDKNCNDKHWGFKDPRILLNYPFWESLFPEAILYGTIRNPIDVASSWQRRANNLSLEDGLNLWLYYNKNLLHILQKKPFPLISFDYPSKLYKEKTEVLLSLLFPNTPPKKVNFFDNSLRTKSQDNPKLSHEIKECYSQLKSYLY